MITIIHFIFISNLGLGDKTSKNEFIKLCECLFGPLTFKKAIYIFSKTLEPKTSSQEQPLNTFSHNDGDEVDSEDIENPLSDEITLQKIAKYFIKYFTNAKETNELFDLFYKDMLRDFEFGPMYTSDNVDIDKKINVNTSNYDNICFEESPLIKFDESYNENELIWIFSKLDRLLSKDGKFVDYLKQKYPGFEKSLKYSDNNRQDKNQYPNELDSGVLQKLLLLYKIDAIGRYKVKITSKRSKNLKVSDFDPHDTSFLRTPSQMVKTQTRDKMQYLTKPDTTEKRRLITNVMYDADSLMKADKNSLKRGSVMNEFTNGIELKFKELNQKEHGERYHQNSQCNNFTPGAHPQLVQNDLNKTTHNEYISLTRPTTPSKIIRPEANRNDRQTQSRVRERQNSSIDYNGNVTNNEGSRGFVNNNLSFGQNKLLCLRETDDYDQSTFLVQMRGTGQTPKANNNINNQKISQKLYVQLTNNMNQNNNTDLNTNYMNKRAVSQLKWRPIMPAQFGNNTPQLGQLPSSVVKNKYMAEEQIQTPGLISKRNSNTVI